ncbi:TPA: lytic transglycosylase domain-containing protein [Enterobacter asburiae]
MTLTSVLVSCVMEAAFIYDLPPKLVVSIIKVEGGKIGLVSKNKNKTEDLGIMQINTGAWLNLVARAHFNDNRALAYRELRDNGCYNIHIGSWILRRSIDQSKGDFWHGVGRYHSATPVHNIRYQAKVRHAWTKYFPE